jgi:protein SCO1/2
MVSGWLTLLADRSTFGHGDEIHTVKEPDAAAKLSAQDTDVELLDFDLVDSNENSVKFKSEAIGDRIVAIDFVYTNCSTICPVVSSVFAQVQEQLGDRLSGELRLVSISIDPNRDTPSRLREYSSKFNAGPGWTWLTGPKRAVDRVLVGLDAYTAEIVDHPSMVLIGDTRTGSWTRLFGFPAPEDIVSRLEERLTARAAARASLGQDN